MIPKSAKQSTPGELTTEPFSSPSIGNIAEDNTNLRQLIRNAESNPSDYKSWYKLAERLLEEEEYKQAIISYDKAIEINPNNKDSWYNRGLALTKVGKYDEAIKSFDKAISIIQTIFMHGIAKPIFSIT